MQGWIGLGAACPLRVPPVPFWAAYALARYYRAAQSLIFGVTQERMDAIWRGGGKGAGPVTLPDPFWSHPIAKSVGNADS